MASTLIFISECGSTISSVLEGRSSNIRVNMVSKLFEPEDEIAFNEKCDHI